MRGLPLLSLGATLAIAVAGLAAFPRSAPAAVTHKLRPRTGVAVAATTATKALDASGSASPKLEAASNPRFESLAPLSIENQMTRQTARLKLYDAQGQVDETTAAQLDALLCDARDPDHHETTRINRRTLQLLYKAAYHFQRYEVEVVSAYRKPGKRSEGPHGRGDAIDFRLHGVSAIELARYLRTLPCTGIGVYTHRKTQFVHLDSREHSFHWLDASPPGRHWREKSIGTRDLAQRDARHTPESDLP